MGVTLPSRISWPPRALGLKPTGKCKEYLEFIPANAGTGKDLTCACIAALLKQRDGKVNFSPYKSTVRSVRGETQLHYWHERIGKKLERVDKQGAYLSSI